MASDVIYVNLCDGLEGIYVDGYLYHHGHDIPTNVWLRLLSRVGDDETTIRQYSYEEGEDEQLDPAWVDQRIDDGDNFPDEAKDLKLRDDTNGTGIED